MTPGRGDGDADTVPGRIHVSVLRCEVPETWYVQRHARLMPPAYTPIMSVKDLHAVLLALPMSFVDVLRRVSDGALELTEVWSHRVVALRDRVVVGGRHPIWFCGMFMSLLTAFKVQTGSGGSGE